MELVEALKVILVLKEAVALNLVFVVLENPSVWRL
jgi:hypothetical protein